MADKIEFDIEFDRKGGSDVDQIKRDLKEIKEATVQLTKATKSSNKEDDEKAKRLKELKEKFTQSAVAVGVMGAALVSLARDANEQNQINKQLESSVARLGLSAQQTAKFLKQANDEFAKNQARGMFGDEDQARALTQLTNRTRNHVQALRLLNSAQDIAQATGKDLADVAQKLGEAYNGDIGPLKELGLITPERIKQLSKEKDATAAAQMELTKITESYRDSRFEVDKVAQASKRWENDLGDLKQALGQATIETTALLADVVGLTNSATNPDETLPGLLARSFSNFGGAIKELKRELSGFKLSDVLPDGERKKVLAFYERLEMIEAKRAQHRSKILAQLAKDDQRQLIPTAEDVETPTSQRELTDDGRVTKSESAAAERIRNRKKYEAEAERRRKEREARRKEIEKRIKETEEEVLRLEREHIRELGRIAEKNAKRKTAEREFTEYLAKQEEERRLIREKENAAALKKIADDAVAQANQSQQDIVARRRRLLDRNIANIGAAATGAGEGFAAGAAGVNALADTAAGGEIGRLEGMKREGQEGLNKAIDERIERIRKETEAYKEQQNAIAALGQESSKVAAAFAAMAQSSWTMKEGSEAATSAMQASVGIAGMVATALDASTKQQAGIQAAFHGAAAIGALALGIATGAPNYFAAAAKHGVAAVQFGIVAGTAGGANAAAGNFSGGGGAATAGSTIDLQRERQATADAIAGALNTGGPAGGATVVIDMRGSTVLENDEALGRRLTDMVQREMRDRPGRRM